MAGLSSQACAALPPPFAIVNILSQRKNPALLKNKMPHLYGSDMPCCSSRSLVSDSLAALSISLSFLNFSCSCCSSSQGTLLRTCLAYKKNRRVLRPSYHGLLNKLACWPAQKSAMKG